MRQTGRWVYAKSCNTETQIDTLAKQTRHQTLDTEKDEIVYEN